MDQSASFFDPSNKKAAQLREQCAMETLDDLLDYILNGNGSVGIFDATNSTLARRKQIMERIRERAGPELNVLFVESVCKDPTLLESNMRLKLSGPDYDGKDPVAALEDFKQRVAIYEKNYIPLGDYEEDNNMPFVSMIDVGRKMISHQVRGFLAGQAVYYLLNFNLSPRMIWITRHGESVDNVAGRIGGDSDLSENGRKYAKAMTRFIGRQQKAWEVHQADKVANTHFPPIAGDHTPPNPHYSGDIQPKNFCIWTSMLKRSIQTAENFCDEEYDIKQMRMLDELNAGIMEGMTYEDIRIKHAEEYERRKRDKLAYRYPGPGGEGYLDIINRIRPVIVELERMTDHCLLVTHRSIARVLIAYFQGLKREDVADLDCPLGMLYQLEPKPYGVEFKAWRYNAVSNDFDHLPDYKLRRATTLNN
ncbi:fructose-2,6-bisphosphatase-like protein [Lophiostoma macrostomum CBS 122681]|uniref:Fructose-2,6-bisphosphatase-like protein n=1 Tax=Lophiostoma macrostomum CBS 122681 TaxID=1314788 RepID=A0A6A6TNS7_9PLEO|nr:fructose-2,6-bisphosphatase-like protein [Lophiostoma macrostomum CBS 122681]